MQAQLALLKYSLFTCALLAIFVSVSILDARPTDSESVVEQVVGIVSRVPAALPAMLTETPKIETHADFQVWQPPCLGPTSKLPALATNSHWLRLATATCDRHKEILDTSLLNESNGFVATVFTPNRSNLTSDFIPLAAGKNNMHMEVKLASGETLSYRWTIQRRTTGSN